MSIQFKTLAAAAASVVFLLLGQQAVAQQQGGCCDPCWKLCGDWEVGAHALYFTPITCPYAYATVQRVIAVGDFNDNSGQSQMIPCRAEWGFRVYGNYVQDCFFVGVSYQWFNDTTTRSIVSDNLRLQGGGTNGTGKATGQVNVEYQNVDVRLGRYLLRGCHSSLYLYGNARWIDLSHRRSERIAIFTSGTREDLREKSELQGGALGIGFGGEFDIWCDFGAFIDGNLLGVIGSRSIKDVRFRSFSFTATTDLQETYPSETCVIPEVDFRIGLNYTYQCGCWALVGEVGYEVDYFWQASAFPDHVSSVLPNDRKALSVVCDDLGFSGLFFAGRFIF